MAQGTARTVTETALVSRIAALTGYTTDPNEAEWTDEVTPGDWLVTAPVGGQPPARRWIVIGVADGAFELEGLAASTGSGEDVWSIACGIACTDIEDAVEGKQAVEDVFNDIADMLAANPRLGLNNGVHDVHPAAIDGPYSEQKAGEPRLSWLNFDVSASCTIRRNIP